jgi:hypothetical protein
MEKFKELNRTGVEEEVAGRREEPIDEEWFGVMQRNNTFRITIREE